MNLVDLQKAAHRVLEEKNIESDYIEYKKSDKQLDKILKTICAYANNYMNRDYGFLFIGVEEENDNELKAIPKRPIIGIEEGQIEIIENNIKSLFKYIQPKPVCHFISDKIDDRFYLVIVVEPSMRITEVTEKGANVVRLPKGGRYIRISRDTILPSQKQEYELLKKFSQYSFCSDLHETATLDDLNYEYMKEYLVQTSAADDVKRLSKLEMARALNLVGNTALTGQRVKNFAILMFADNPSKYIPEAYVQVIREVNDGTTRMQAVKFDGPIWIQAKKVSKYFEEEIMRSYTVRYDDKIEHDIIYNWPLTTFEELATNCILHNQYDNYQYIGIYVYKDRIEFINHNRPVPPLTTKDLNEKDYFADRQYANPPIKEMFFALNLIESYGSGIRRAKEALEKNKSPKMRFLPEDTDMDYTLVTVPINNEFFKIKSTEIKDIERIAKDLTVIESQILQIIKENPKISINKLSEKISKSPTTTKRYLRNLVENQIIERENGNKKGAWIFLKK